MSQLPSLGLAAAMYRQSLSAVKTAQAAHSKAAQVVLEAEAAHRSTLAALEAAEVKREEMHKQLVQAAQQEEVS